MSKVSYIFVSKFSLFAYFFILWIGATFLMYEDWSYLKSFQVMPKYNTSWYHNLPTSTYIKNLEPVKILLVAFPRSGSSLLGRVLSADYNSIYLFEPFHGRIFKYENGTPVDLHHHIVNEIMIKNYTNQLFNCMHPAYVHNKWALKSIENVYERCYQSNKIVIKTIRLHSNNLIQWIPKTNIKIIQLIRDPRAILFSQFKAKKMFSEWTYDIPSLCQMMIDDSKLKKILPPNRFAQLYYEDLIEKPTETLIKLFNDLEMPVDYQAIKSINRHLSEVPPAIETNNYVSTYRGLNYDTNVWKTKMDTKVLRNIETTCTDTLQTYGYHPLLSAAG